MDEEEELDVNPTTHTRLVRITLDKSIWNLLDQLSYTLSERVRNNGGDPRKGCTYKEIISAMTVESLLEHSDEIQRDYEKARRDRVTVRIANLNRRYRDPLLADAIRTDGRGAITIVSEET
jgi:hypothetical protein